MLKEDKVKRILACAEKVDVIVLIAQEPHDWQIPLFEGMIKRIEDLEKRLRE